MHINFPLFSTLSGSHDYSCCCKRRRGGWGKRKIVGFFLLFSLALFFLVTEISHRWIMFCFHTRSGKCFIRESFFCVCRRNDPRKANNFMINLMPSRRRGGRWRHCSDTRKSWHVVMQLNYSRRVIRAGSSSLWWQTAGEGDLGHVHTTCNYSCRTVLKSWTQLISRKSSQNTEQLLHTLSLCTFSSVYF